MSRPSAASSSHPQPGRSTYSTVDDSDSDDERGSSSSGKTSAPYCTDARGDEFVAQATKKLNSFSFFGGTSKYEAAIELLEKAAAQYKLNKNWQEAGEVYAQMAQIYTDKLREQHDAGVNWQNAAKAFSNVNTREAIRCYQAAVDILMENNKFNIAAKLWREMGTIQEKEHQLATAMQSYQKAADCYEADNAAANATAMHVKVAGLSAEVGDYKRAISIYEKVSKASLDNSALRWSVKDYLFKALLCHFVMQAPSHKLDLVSSKLEQYLDMCPSLDNTREKQLIENLIEAFNADDSDKFADHVFRYDEISKLDNWTAKVLLDIKKALEEGGGGEEGIGV